MALATLAGCAMGHNARALADSQAKDMRIFGQYVLVTGSRTRHRVDAYGDAITPNPVQIITARELNNMPGLSLGERLSGF